MTPNDAPLVAVIVPCRDDAVTLPRALASIARQTVPHRVVVVDDGSAEPLTRTDLGDDVTLVRTDGVGPAAARNAGVAASGDTPWVAFLDADDWWTDDCLALQLAHAARRPDAEVLWGRTHILREADDPRVDGTGHVTQLAALLFTRQAWSLAGGLWPDLRAAEDLDVVWRMVRTGVRVHRHDDVVSHYALRSDSVTAGARLGPRAVVDLVRDRLAQRRRAPEVGVVVCVRNGMPWVADALASVLGQDPPPVDVVVVDGHSTDGTQDVLASTAGIRWFAQRRPGLYAAYNEALGEVRGEWIGFCSADDRWTSRRLQAQLAVVTPDIDVVLGATTFVALAEDAGIPGRSLAGTTRTTLLLESMLMRRRVVEMAGPFSEDLGSEADVAWIGSVLGQARGRADCGVTVLHKGLHERNTMASGSGSGLTASIRHLLAQRRAGS